MQAALQLWHGLSTAGKIASAAAAALPTLYLARKVRI